MGLGGFFPTHLELANILGDIDFDSDVFSCFVCFRIPNFQIFRFPNWPGLGLDLGLGRAWAVAKPMAVPWWATSVIMARIVGWLLFT